MPFPFVTEYRKIGSLTEKITLVYTYYDNPRTLAFHVGTINGFSREVRDSIEVIFVDDASPENPAHIHLPDPKFSLRIFRVSVDKPWNHRAARNIGAHEARAPWLFLLDIDTHVPEATLRALLRMNPDTHHWFLFTLRDLGTGQKIGRHHDTIFMAKEFYWRMGGFDEHYAGIYGAGPVFSIAIEKRFPWTHLEALDVFRIPGKISSDASTTQFARKARATQRVKLHLVRFLTASGLLQKKTLQEAYTQTR
jgi:hypothetical protein